MIAFIVAATMGVLEVRRIMDCDCAFDDMCVGLFWPVTRLIYICGHAATLFPQLCIWISDAIDRFVAKEGKKRLEKSEPRGNR